jgi:hypothetical protein
MPRAANSNVVPSMMVTGLMPPPPLPPPQLSAGLCGDFLQLK